MAGFRAAAVQVIRRAKHGLYRLLTDGRIVKVRDEVGHNKGLSELLDKVTGLNLHRGAKGAVESLALAHLAAELHKFCPLLLCHPGRHIIHRNFLMGDDGDVLAGKLRDADSDLVLDVLVGAASAANRLSDAAVDLSALLAGGRDDRAAGKNLDACGPHELGETLFGEGVLGRGRFVDVPLAVAPLVLGFLHLIDFAVVEVGTDAHGVHHRLLDVGNLRHGLHRDEEVVLRGRVLLRNGERSVFVLFVHGSRSC